MTVLRGVVLAAAVAALTACVTVSSDKPQVNIEEAVTARIAAGAEYLRMGRPAEARRHFSRALSLDADSPAANNAMALLYSYERDGKNEERYYRSALRADSNYAPALNNYGTLLYTQGRYEEAADKFRRAADQLDYRERASALSNLGLSCERAGDLDQAEKAFIKALRLRPGMLVATRELAQVYYQQQRYQRGWRYFQRYQQRTRQLDAEALWLGIRLAAALDQRNDLASYQLALENLYPRSDEYQLWQKWKNSQETR